MSLESVKQFFKQYNRDEEIIILNDSSATVALAAQHLHIAEGQVAKTLGFNVKGEYILIVVEGTARIDNKKYRHTFKAKAKMMTPEELMEYTSHPVGGVCPFGLITSIPVYLDVTLKKHDDVYPAAGNMNAAIKISVNDLEQYTQGEWVDVCKDEETDAAA